jgi:GTPase SAR1 family protein
MREVAADLIHLLDDGGDEDLGAVARLVFARVAMRQAYVTVAGETSSGKSTLINGMFGRRVLPVGAGPTTAAVTHVICWDEERDRYFAVFRDATQEELDREAFVGLNSSPPKDLLRLQVRARPNREDLVGLHVFDTPGYNSIFTEHGEVLEEFLPQSDVVIFVVGYKAGFGQNDQDLLEAMGGLTSDDVEVPVILVVNRVPPNVAADDRRISEIVSNAADTLGGRPPVVIIPSATANRREAGAATLPDTDGLWWVVAEAVAEPERRTAVDRKLHDLLRSLIDDADDRAERQELALSADAEQAREQLEAIGVLERQREASLAAVARTTERLRLLIPGSIEAATNKLRTALAAEVGASNKWLGSADCPEWISGHFLPFEVRTIARSVENQISGELTQLDQELQEIANTAVKELTRKVNIAGNRGRFAVNLAGTLARRVGGIAWRSLLRGKGGVGGTAAGAGNLVKMVVSRAGRLVGKTFSREVYTQIGRTFNKQFMRRLNVVITVVVEVSTYIYSSSTWQADLVRQVSKALDEWKVEVINDVMNKQLPSIHEANENSVRDIYGDLVGAGMEGLDGRDQNGRLEEISARRAAFTRLRESLEVNFR